MLPELVIREPLHQSRHDVGTGASQAAGEGRAVPDGRRSYREMVIKRLPFPAVGFAGRNQPSFLAAQFWGPSLILPLLSERTMRVITDS